MFKKLCIATILFLTLASTAHAGWGVSWAYSPFGWSTTFRASTGNSWLMYPTWSNWIYTPTYFYSMMPRYYTVLYPSPSPAQQRLDYQRSMNLLRTKEWAYKYELEQLKEKESEPRVNPSEIQIDLKSTPSEQIEETPTPAQTQEPSQEQENTNTPTPQGVYVMNEGSVVMKVY